MREFASCQTIEPIVGTGVWIVRNPAIGAIDTAVDDGFGELVFVPVFGAMLFLSQEH